MTVKFDYGVGGAIVTNKQLNHGAGFTAGELGHYKAFKGEEALRCHCGNFGCLTTLASISGLARNAGYRLDEFKPLVQGGDAKAVQLFNRVVEAMADLLSDVITFVNPDHVLLTGKWLDAMKDLALPLLKEKLVQSVPSFSRNFELLLLPETPNESVSAAGLVLNRFFEVPLHQHHV